MPFPRRLLIEGEELILDLRPHWIALLGPALVAIVGLAVAAWLATVTSDSLEWLPWVVYVILLVVYPLPKLVWWLTSNFAVTSDRVIHREGFIAKRSMEIPLEAINDVRFDQGVVDRVIGAGTLVVQSASEAGRQVFDHIRKPEEVQKTIYHQGELNQQRMMRGSDGRSTHSSTSELERLAALP